jgi:hypothetical protein
MVKRKLLMSEGNSQPTVWAPPAGLAVGDTCAPGEAVAPGVPVSLAAAAGLAAVAVAAPSFSSSSPPPQAARRAMPRITARATDKILISCSFLAVDSRKHVPSARTGLFGAV